MSPGTRRKSFACRLEWCANFALVASRQRERGDKRQDAQDAGDKKPSDIRTNPHRWLAGCKAQCEGVALASRRLSRLLVYPWLRHCSAWRKAFKRSWNGSATASHHGDPTHPPSLERGAWGGSNFGGAWRRGGARSSRRENGETLAPACGRCILQGPGKMRRADGVWSGTRLTGRRAG